MQVVPSAKDGLHCGGFLAQRATTRLQVVPSAKDGLHCGGRVPGPGNCLRGRRRPVRQGRAPLRLDRGRVTARALARRPVRQGRAPLRPHPNRVTRPDMDRRPVRQGRAPLRRHPGPPPARPDPGRPVRQGRAPLRRRDTGGWLARAGASSRPPRTGSIAARRSSMSAARPVRSSRPPRTGSIAAPSASVTTAGAGTGRPVRQGRAPLRLRRVDIIEQRFQRVVPSAKDGLHCGITAALAPGEAVLVVPSAKDGLHCGLPVLSSTGDC